MTVNFLFVHRISAHNQEDSANGITRGVGLIYTTAEGERHGSRTAWVRDAEGAAHLVQRCRGEKQTHR